MDVFEEDRKPPVKAHDVGQDLSLLSAGDLAERIALLKEEIVRLEAELAARDSTKAAAEALFRTR